MNPEPGSNSKSHTTARTVSVLVAIPIMYLVLTPPIVSTYFLWRGAPLSYPTPPGWLVAYMTPYGWLCNNGPTQAAFLAYGEWWKEVMGL